VRSRPSPHSVSAEGTWCAAVAPPFGAANWEQVIAGVLSLCMFRRCHFAAAMPIEVEVHTQRSCLVLRSAAEGSHRTQATVACVLCADPCEEALSAQEDDAGCAVLVHAVERQLHDDGRRGRDCTAQHHAGQLAAEAPPQQMGLQAFGTAAGR